MRRIILAFRNIIILKLCYLYFFVHGNARHAPAGDPKKILVMPASKLGDMVCATPIFRAIKKKYPECKVVVFGTTPYAELHKDNPDVNAYRTWDEKRSFWQLISIMKEEKADAAVFTTPGFFATAIFFLAGIRMIVAPKVIGGFSPYQTKSYRMMMPLVTTVNHEMGKYAPREYLKLLEPLGIQSDDTKKILAFPESVKNKIAEYYKTSGFILGTDSVVGISVSAGNEIKKWSNKNFAGVANWISEKYAAKIIFIGSNSDKPDIQETIENLNKNVRFLNAAGAFSIEELKAVISMMDLFIAVDTGPIYIAEAFDIPTVDIVGPMDELEQPPTGEFHKVVVPERKKPELHIMNARAYDVVEAKRQIESITTEAVKKEIQDLAERGIFTKPRIRV